MTSIHVDVQTMGGSSAEFDLAGEETVLSLKMRLEEELKVPTLCQTLLLLEGEDLKDEQLLESLGLEELSLTLVVSAERLYAQLQDGSKDWTQAIEALDMLDPADEHVVGVLAKVLNSFVRRKGRRRARQQKDEVGQLASKILVRLAAKDHRGAYDALDDCLGCIDPLRSLARKALLKEELRGHATLAAGAVGRGLKRRDGEPRDALFVRLEVMGQLATEDNAEVREAALTLLGSKTAELKVKISACKRLAHVLGAGGEATRQAMSKALRQTFLANMRRYAWSDLPLQLEAVQQMAIFATRNDAETVRCCLRMLSTSLDSSRVAVKILCSTVDRGVPSVVEALCESVRTGFESYERAAAAEALGHLASEGDAQALACLCDAIKDTAEVAQSAATAISKVACRGHQGALSVVKPLLEHEDGWVRAAAPGALASLIAPGEEAELLEALVKLAQGQSSYSEAREAALKALGDLCPTACAGALEAAGPVVRGGDRQLGIAAVKLLAQVAASEPYTARAMAALIDAAVPASFLDVDETLQDEVVKALMGLAKDEGPLQEAARTALEALSKKRLAHPALMASKALTFLKGEGEDPFLNSGEEDSDSEQEVSE